MTTILDYMGEPDSTQDAVHKATICLRVAESQSRVNQMPAAFGCWADEAVRMLLWASWGRA